MIRTLTETDIPALVELCRRTLPLDEFTEGAIRRRVFEEPGFNERYLLVDERQGKLVAVMFGSTRQTRNGPQAWVRLFSVVPEWREQGIATKLLQEFERRFREDHYTTLNIANSTPDYFWPGVDVRYTPAICWLLKNGFQRSGEAFNMEVALTGRDFDTSEEERKLAERGITVRRLMPEDREQFDAWMSETWSSGWRSEALASYKNTPVTTFVALDNGKFAGFASYDNAMFDGYFGPMGTAQHLRGLGIGGILFLRCMADMQARGYNRCEVCWVGPAPFYAKVAGAWINRVFWQYSKPLV